MFAKQTNILRERNASSRLNNLFSETIEYSLHTQMSEWEYENSFFFESIWVLIDVACSSAILNEAKFNT